ncbi:hypothetical protein ACFLYM_00045 [Chloroflexota bacterium]
MERDSSNNEKKFTEYIDKLLAGEEVSPGDDISDEMRSALDFARVMLSNRDEPSPAFRAQLRERLLQKLYEQEAEASRAAEEKKNPLDWIRNLLPPRPAWRLVTSAALVVLVAVIGVIWYSTSRVPSLPSPELTTEEYQVNLPASVAPDRITFAVTTSLSSKSEKAAIYKIETPEVTIESVNALGSRLGFSGEAAYADDKEKIVITEGTGSAARQLTVWTASGAVEYGYVEPDKLYPLHTPELPSQGDAGQIAYDFMEGAGLLPPDYDSYAGIKDEIYVSAGGSYSIIDRATGKTTQKDPSFWLVSLPYFIDGYPSTGPGARIEASIGENGEVIRLVSAWRELILAYSGKVISEQRAYDDLAGGEGSLEVPLDCKQVVVNEVALTYWIDPASEKQDYALPVYEFKGECLDQEGRLLEEFTAWTEALIKTY